MTKNKIKKVIKQFERYKKLSMRVFYAFMALATLNLFLQLKWGMILAFIFAMFYALSAILFTWLAEYWNKQLNK